MKFIIIACMLFNTVLFSQNDVVVNYGLVFHATQTSESLKATNPDYYNSLLKEAERADELNFELKINGQQSYFNHKKIEDEQDQELKILLERAQGLHVFYTDLKRKKTFEQIDYWGQLVLIETSTSDMPWEITSEQKTIKDYLCTKATKTYIDRQEGREFTLKVEAWYTEDIPLQFGPLNYNSLPGLVLELTENNMTYYVKNINFKADFQPFSEPTRGIKMTLEEFSEESSKMQERAKQVIINSRG